MNHRFSCVFRVRGGGTMLDQKGGMSVFRGPPGLREGNLESQITKPRDCFWHKKFIQRNVDKE